VWLEDYLSTYNKTLIVISHSQDFLNGVCTAMMVMQEQKLRYWSGNYDAYIKTRTEQETNQIKLYKKQQVEIAEIKQFIASCGTYANLVRQAKSREKILEKMEADGLLEMPYQEPLFRFKFADAGDLSPPLISFSEVAFRSVMRPCPSVPDAYLVAAPVPLTDAPCRLCFSSHCTLLFLSLQLLGGEEGLPVQEHQLRHPPQVAHRARRPQRRRQEHALEAHLRGERAD
jgi:dihydroxyacetone kinase DhaKLM complex PTS-EIIA-like component DhaM